MLSCMRTTVDLPDELLIEAKKRAVDRRTTLRALLEAGLRAELARDTAAAQVTSLRLVTVEGGLSGVPDLTDRAAMHSWLAEEP